MNLKNNKGYVGVDASIAVLILLIIIPTITGIIYNINKTNNEIARKTKAINIATNVIEATKAIDYQTASTETTQQAALIAKIKELYTDVDTDDGIAITEEKDTYKVEYKITDYADTDEGKSMSAISGKVKTAEVKISYKSGQEVKYIEFTTSFAC